MFDFSFLDIITFIGLLFLISQACGRLAHYLKAPAIVGYLLAGVLFGPSVLNVFSAKLVNEDLYIITNITLSIIAFSLGGALKIPEIKKIHNRIFSITLFQALFAGIVVFVTMMFLLPMLIPNNHNMYVVCLAMALVLGAISVATAPGAIMSIIHEYKAKGTFTTTLMGVISLDDGIAIILYSFAMEIARTLLMGETLYFSSALLWPFLHIIFSVGLGLVVGLLLKMIITYFHPKDVLLGLIIGAILFVSGLSISFDFSPLLANMALGFFVVNYIQHNRSDEAFNVIEGIEEPIFGIFFLLGGAKLEMDLSWVGIILALVLLTSRFAGKIAGSYVGARISHSPSAIRKYMGLSLLPTAGVTVGLALEASTSLSFYSQTLAALLVNSVIGATLINELVSPFLLRFSLSKAGEIGR